MIYDPTCLKSKPAKPENMIDQCRGLLNKVNHKNIVLIANKNIACIQTRLLLKTGVHLK